MLFPEIILQQIIVHNVGNKQNEEGYLLSENTCSPFNPITEKTIIDYLTQSFTPTETYHFSHQANVQLNECYSYTKAIFDNPKTFVENSQHIAKHLYQNSTHPKIKNGDVYIAHFSNCFLEGKKCEAIGIYKTENKDTILQTYQHDKHYEIKKEEGVLVRKVEKACLVFNTEAEDGFTVLVIDNSNKGNEAQYWKDSFLQLAINNDAYTQTKQVLDITKNFVQQQLAQEFDVSKTDQIDIQNKAIEYFKLHEVFDKKNFATEVLTNEAIIQSFNNYNEEYCDAYKLPSPTDGFAIHANAVKKQVRAYKSVLKLDKNFHIYIHGNTEMIENGVDENGRKFYKIFYEEEN